MVLVGIWAGDAAAAEAMIEGMVQGVEIGADTVAMQERMMQHFAQERERCVMMTPFIISTV